MRVTLALALALAVVLGACGSGGTSGAPDAGVPDSTADASGLEAAASDGSGDAAADGAGDAAGSGDAAGADAGDAAGGDAASGDAGPECTTSTQCPAARPICDLDVCRPCERHSECSERGLAYCTAGGECVACQPGAALRCDSGSLVSCAADGSGEVSTPCTYGCSDTYRRCNDCAPSADSCTGTTLTTCNADGYVAATRECALGCHPGGARCYDVDPANGLASYLDQAASAPAVVLADGATIDTDTGVVTSGGQDVSVPSATEAAPTGGVALRVFMVQSLSAGALTVTGTRALAVVADGDVTLGGLVDLTAHGATPGPGSLSYSATHACQGDDAMAGDPAFPGGGGGGFGSGGARGGGVGTPAVGGGLGGDVDGDAPLVPLRGGCWGGGSLSTSPYAFAPGGGGGGAAQIVSRTIIRVTAAESGGICTPAGLVAGGGGGTAGAALATGGAGGGAGGGLLLEAPAVAVTGCSQAAMPLSGLFANGGGGGCAALGGGDGDAQAGPGADCTIAGEGDGGHGGSGAGFAAPGGDVTTSPGWGGGGGGGAGRIRVDTADATLAVTGAAAWISPAASLGTVGRR